MSIKALVVTRHPALVEFLIERGYISADSEVIEHATAEDVTGKHVWGVLPHSMSVLTKSFTEIPLNLPAEMRGKELGLEDMKLYAGTPVTYVVKTQQTLAEELHSVWYAGYGSEWTPKNGWEAYAIGE